ncbi:unnamed protein product [Closterium sp. NIES-53]
MCGRLRLTFAWWSSWCPCSLVLSIIANGYWLPWSHGPPQAFRERNHAGAYAHATFTRTAIQELTETGVAVETAASELTCISPLNVVEQREKCRLILDLRKVNANLIVPKFKYEGLSRVADVARAGDWMFSIDLKSGYHHIDVHPSYWKFLGFGFDGRTYSFRSLPFGLATAPFVFTQLIKIAGMLSSMGVALGATARAFSHAMLQVINDAPSWKSSVIIPPPAAEELNFWLEEFDRFNGASFHGVFFILRKGGSRSPDLTTACQGIIRTCMEHGTHLIIEWIPRELNSHADEISKAVDHDDYSLKTPWFRILERCWGPHSIDLFANSRNSQLPRFCTKIPHPQATARTHASLTLIIPHWPSANWWPLLQPSPRNWAPSSCEAEIYAGAMAAQELRWLTYLLTDLGEQPRSPPVLYVDNKAMLALCREHRLEHRTKHIALRYFLARELQQRGQLRLAYVASEANTADIFTKALAPRDHQHFSTMLCLLALLCLSGLVTSCFPTCTHHSVNSFIPVSSHQSPVGLLLLLLLSAEPVTPVVRRLSAPVATVRAVPVARVSAASPVTFYLHSSHSLFSSSLSFCDSL